MVGSREGCDWWLGMPCTVSPKRPEDSMACVWNELGTATMSVSRTAAQESAGPSLSR